MASPSLPRRSAAPRKSSNTWRPGISFRPRTLSLWLQRSNTSAGTHRCGSGFPVRARPVCDNDGCGRERWRACDRSTTPPYPYTSQPGTPRIRFKARTRCGRRWREECQAVSTSAHVVRRTIGKTSKVTGKATNQDNSQLPGHKSSSSCVSPTEHPLIAQAIMK